MVIHSGRSSENEDMGHFVSLPPKSDENGIPTAVYDFIMLAIHTVGTCFLRVNTVNMLFLNYGHWAIQ